MQSVVHSAVVLRNYPCVNVKVLVMVTPHRTTHSSEEILSLLLFHQHDSICRLTPLPLSLGVPEDHSDDHHPSFYLPSPSRMDLTSLYFRHEDDAHDQSVHCVYLVREQKRLNK